MDANKLVELAHHFYKPVKVILLDEDALLGALDMAGEGAAIIVIDSLVVAAALG